MKHRVMWYSMPFLLILLPTSSNARQNFSISLEPTWKNLDQNQDKEKKFGGKWILAGSITFKKKSKNIVALGKVFLKWHGPYLENMIGSLYKQRPDKNFIPIEENLIADGTWNQKKQTLMFHFPSNESLGAVNTFYLVLTIPLERESLFVQGHFSLEKTCLPGPYQECIYNNKLAFNQVQLPRVRS